MLRASSGKHARFVGVFAAGGDSIPTDPADPADLADPLMSSKNRVFIEMVVTFDTGEHPRVMFFQLV